jgi:hypothetical protein
MTAYVLDLVPEMRKSHRPQGIVMAVVIAVALVPVIAVLGPAPSGARTSTPDEFVTVPAPGTNGPELPQSLGYVEYDWSAGGGGVPGFGLLSDNLN